jgi:hypothetical protein
MFIPIIEDSRLRQLWRLTHTLIKVRNGALTRRDVKNGDRSDYVYENKGMHDTMPDNHRGFLAHNGQIAR